VNRNSFLNVERKWYPEIEDYSRKIPVILVGLKSDLRDDPDAVERLSLRGESLVSFDEAVEMRDRIDAKCYVECSSYNYCGLEELLEKISDEYFASFTKIKRSGGCVIV